MSGKSRLRKAFVLRARKLRALVEKADLARPRAARVREKPAVRVVEHREFVSNRAVCQARIAAKAAKSGGHLEKSDGVIPPRNGDAPPYGMGDTQR